MRCRAVRKWMVEFASDGVDPAREADFRAHLAACPRCAAEWADIEIADRLLGHLVTPEPDERILAAMAARVEERLDHETQPLLRPRRLSLAAAGAFVCLLIGLGVGLRHYPRATSAPVIPTVDVVPVPSGEFETAEAPAPETDAEARQPPPAEPPAVRAAPEPAPRPGPNLASTEVPAGTARHRRVGSEVARPRRPRRRAVRTPRARQTRRLASRPRPARPDRAAETRPRPPVLAPLAPATTAEGGLGTGLERETLTAGPGREAGRELASGGVAALPRPPEIRVVSSGAFALQAAPAEAAGEAPAAGPPVEIHVEVAETRATGHKDREKADVEMLEFTIVPAVLESEVVVPTVVAGGGLER